MDTETLFDRAARARHVMEVRIACPPEREPSMPIRVGAEPVADLHGGSVWMTDDPREAMAGADAVYTAPWVPPGREARVERLRRYQVHRGLMERTSPHAVFMHPLPARRREEVSAQIIDGARSIVWQRAANRVPAEEAAIHVLVSARRGVSRTG